MSGRVSLGPSPPPGVRRSLPPPSSSRDIASDARRGPIHTSTNTNTNNTSNMSESSPNFISGPDLRSIEFQNLFQLEPSHTLKEGEQKREYTNTEE